MKKLSSIFLIMIFLISLANMAIAERDDDEYEQEDEHEEYREPEAIKLPEYAPIPVVEEEVVVPIETEKLIQKTPTKITSNEKQAPKTTAITTNIDTDQDGIIDKDDKHPGEDDFAFQAIDMNKNGIVDDLENIAK